MIVLILNAGSSSIKYNIFEFNKNKPSEILSGLIEGIGEKQGNWHHKADIKSSTAQTFSSHKEAFAALSEKLQNNLHVKQIYAIGHRVVHGGEHFKQPTIVTNDVLQTIKSLAKLAPLHNPVNAIGIEFSMRYFPKAIQVAVFDTGFHQTMPLHVYKYAINNELAQQEQIRRYGFHGINHEFVANKASDFLGKKIDACNFISLHLGNGASACLIKDGESFDTTMGMTPLAGLIMGSRCGDIDPAIPLYLQQTGYSIEDVDKMLNKNSGLVGIAGDNDMRNLVSRMESGDETAKLAIKMYVYSIQKAIGAYLSQTPKLDALIFTGGVGENASIIREMIIQNLSHFNLNIDNEQNYTKNNEICHNIAKSGTPILTIKGDEALYISLKTIEKIYKSQKF